MNRIMSLGYNCLSAQITKSFNVREPGPLDWALQLSTESLLNALSGSLFLDIINKRYSIKYNISDKGYVTELPYIRYCHEYLDNPNELSKLIIRLVHFIDHINMNNRFIMNLNPSYSETDLIKIREYLNLSGITDDRLFVIGNELAKSFKYHYIIDFNNHITYDFWKSPELYNAVLTSIKPVFEDWYGAKVHFELIKELSTNSTVPRFDGSFNTNLKSINY